MCVVAVSCGHRGKDIANIRCIHANLRFVDWNSYINIYVVVVREGFVKDKSSEHSMISLKMYDGKCFGYSVVVDMVCILWGFWGRRVCI